MSTTTTTTTTTTRKEPMNRQELLDFLSPYCNAIAIPLEGGEDPRFPVLGVAMVGHGGGSHQSKSKTSSSAAPAGGTVKPIFVSVGHKISLPEATKVAAFLSRYRIPEPVRQADFFGRKLIRQQQERRAAAEAKNDDGH